MIVRKYNRRSRSLSRSCSDSGFDEAIASDEYENSLSQESPQDIYDFAFSSQDSASHWSFDSESYVSNSSQGARQLAVLPPRKPLIGGDIENGDGAFRMSKKPRNSLDFDPYCLNSSQESRKLAVLPTKKVNGADLENGNGCLRKQKKVKNGSTKELKSKGTVSFSVPLEQTKTLMETEEFGEMMEHEDEVYFALDGLRKGQPARIRRASLLALLSICGTAQQRRLLRTNGYVNFQNFYVVCILTWP